MEGWCASNESCSRPCCLLPNKKKEETINLTELQTRVRKSDSKEMLMPTSTFTHRRKRGTNKDEAKLPPKAKRKRIGRIRSKDLTSVSTTGVFQTTLACSRVYPIGCFILPRFAISLISHKRPDIRKKNSHFARAEKILR